jgi:lactoylglutathione lyase
VAIDNIQLASVFVRDQDRALEFYVGTLGMEKRIDAMEEGAGRRFLVVAPPGSHIGLAIVKGDDADGTTAKIGGFSGIVLGTDDVEGTHAELVGSGVNFIESPTKQEWGALQALLVDPDENVLVLHEN